MNKLKTLNDICWLGYGNNPLEFTNEETRLIKQEAIKWIKELQKNTKTTDNEWNMQSLYPIQWIKLFFNITEEDLK